MCSPANVILPQADGISASGPATEAALHDPCHIVMAQRDLHMQGTMSARFLRHEGFLGAVGAFLKVHPMTPPNQPASVGREPRKVTSPGLDVTLDLHSVTAGGA